MTPDANDLCVFAIKRGRITKRMDVQNAIYLLANRSIIVSKQTLGSLTLEEPCYGTSATAIERMSEEQPKYIRITDFDEFGIEDNHLYMAAESFADKHLLKKGDILFARTGGTVGKTYYYDGSIGPAVFAGYCIRFRFNENIVYSRFVYWYTKTESFKSWVKGIQRPSGQPNINKEEYKSFEIVLPTKEKQHTLIEMMNRASSHRESQYNAACSLISSFGCFVHKCLGFGELSLNKPIVFAVNYSAYSCNRYDPEYHNPLYTSRVRQIQKIHHSSLENIIEFSNETWNQKDYFPDSFPYIEISNVKLKENEYYVTDVSTSKAPSRAKMVVRNGDIIVSSTRPHRGAIATIKCKDNEIQIASTGFCVLRNMKRHDVLKEYLQWILLDDYVLLQMLQRSSGGNYPAINAEELKKIIIPIPDIDIQKQICDEANKRIMKAKHLRMEAEKEWAKAKAQFEKELLGEA